jgi:UDP:flavonoid glycosyltransferase YjiC (YdhE family)
MGLIDAEVIQYPDRIVGHFVQRVRHFGPAPFLHRDRQGSHVGNRRNVQQLAHRNDVWQFASLPAVLPHVRAVVHAAGHGTTAAALHAGVPQVVLPQTFDQTEHARRLDELGVGGTVPWKRRSASRIAAALTQVDGKQTTAAAAAVAASLATEDGTSTAADRIEAFAT